MRRAHKETHLAHAGRKRFARHAGGSLLELLGAIAIGAGVMVGVADQANRYIDNTVAVKSAEYHQAFSDAALQYIRTLDALDQTPTRLTVVNLDTIQQLVPSAGSLKDRNPYNERTCLFIKSRQDTIDPTKRTTIGLVISAGASSQSDVRIAQRRGIAAGLAGLAVGQRAGNDLRGRTWEMTNGVSDWQLNTRGCNNTADRLPEGGLVTDLQLLGMVKDIGQQRVDPTPFLHRLRQTDPKLNTMETTITMSGTRPGVANIDFKNQNDIKNVRNIDTVDKITGVGTITRVTAFDGNDSTVIKNIASIDRVGGISRLGEIKFNRGGGTIEYLGSVNAGGGPVSIGGNVSVAGKVSVGGNVTVGGEIDAAQTVSGGHLKAKTEVRRGGSCSNPGLMALDQGTGAPVFCNREGRWEFYSGFGIYQVRARGGKKGDPAYATCNQGDILLGGGGQCFELYEGEGHGIYHYVHYSAPGGNTWAVDCFDKRGGFKPDALLDPNRPGADSTAEAVAICLKPGTTVVTRN